MNLFPSIHVKILGRMLKHVYNIVSQQPTISPRGVDFIFAVHDLLKEPETEVEQS